MTTAPRAADASWQDRLKEARQKMVFQPTPSGATPYAHTLEQLAEMLDAVEVTGSIAQASSPTDTMCRSQAMLLREAINARMYERNMAARFECGPDRIDELAAKLDVMAGALTEVLRVRKAKANTPLKIADAAE